MFWIGQLAIVVIMIMGFITLCQPKSPGTPYLSVRHLWVLTCIYLQMLIGFGFLYMLYHWNGHAVLQQLGSTPPEPTLDDLWTMFYFSATTLFSLGYGDFVPIGIGRLIAVIESLIGYIIPAALVVRTVLDWELEKKEP